MLKDLNISPYFDDFDPNDNYVKVLFRHGRPIQARELNNLQSIFHHQIKLFAQHIFKNKSRVSGARMNVVHYDYIILANRDERLKEILVFGTSLRGKITQLNANVIHYQIIDGIPVLYVNYNGTAVDGETRHFIEGETIEVLDEFGNVIYTIEVPCQCTGSQYNVPLFGKGSFFSIEEGIFFYEGFFLENEKELLLISEFNTIEEKGEDFEIGFKVNETIVTANEDPSLYENSLGYPNTKTAGADRYKISLELIKRPLLSIQADESLNTDFDEAFILLMRIVGGKIVFQKSSVEYADIQEELARSTYRKNGNFYITPPSIRFLEAKKNHPSDPKGASVNGDPNKFVAVIGPSIYYVLGYRNEKIRDTYVFIPKARETKTLPNYYHEFEELNYILLKPKPNSNSIPINPDSDHIFDNTVIKFYDQPPQLSGSIYVPSGNVIGTAKVIDITYKQGTPGVDAVYKYHLTDISFDSGKTFSDVKGIANDWHFIAEPFLEDGILVHHNPKNTSLVFRIKKDNIKTLKTPSTNKPSLIVIKRTLVKGIVNSEGKITFNPPKNELFEPIDQDTICVSIDNTGSSTVDLSTVDIKYTPTQIHLTFPTSYAGKLIHLLLNCLLINVDSQIKTIQTNTETFSSVGPNDYNLQKTDIIEVKQIYAFLKNDPNNTSSYIDLIDYFKLEKGITDTYYKNGRLIYDTSKTLPNSITSNPALYGLKVVYDYYSREGLFPLLTVDSYGGLISNQVIDYKDIPSYKSKNGTHYPLANCLDFRPELIQNEIRNVIIPKKYCLFDLTYYLPRRDLIQVDKNGNITFKSGVPSDDPKPPMEDNDKMALFELFIPAYTPNVETIRYKRIDHRRYTMRDIGALDERIDKVIYYTTLNLLERNALDFKVKDTNGLDRFKNGIIVDDFRKFQAGDIFSPEFKCAYDIKTGSLSPSFQITFRKLKFDPSHSYNYKNHNGIISFPYSEYVIDEQPFATRTISVNPYYYTTRAGSVVLTPKADIWTDVHSQPDVVINQDLGTDAYRSLNETIQRMGAGIGFSNISGSWNFDSASKSYNLGTSVTDISLIPWMRSIDIRFDAKGLAPNTRVYVFFDGQNVSKYTRPINGNFNDPINTDQTGSVSGIFRVPANTFRPGSKKFRITSSPIDARDEGLICFAETVFYAGGIDLTKQSVILNINNPETTYSPGIETEKTQSTVSSGQVVPISSSPSIPPNPKIESPVAQSFKLENDAFLTGIDLFFQSIDRINKKMFFEIRTMEFGYPTRNVLFRKQFSSIDITPSDNGTVPFSIKFDYPIFVKGGEEYCFVVGGESPDTRIWVARLGEPIIDNPSKKVDTQPSLGSSFRSQNGVTWNAEQFEDLKYRLYSAKFNTNSPMVLAFIDSPEIEYVPSGKMEFEAGSNLIRIYTNGHALKVNDSVKIYLNGDIVIQTTGQLQIGDVLQTSSGKGIIRSIRKTGTDQWNVELEKITGEIQTGQSFTTPSTSGTVITGTPNDINGIPFGQIAKQHTVQTVDTNKTYVISVTGTATDTMIKEIPFYVEQNIPFSIVNIKTNFMKYETKDVWTLEGISYNPNNVSNKVSDYERISPVVIKPNEDTILDQSYKLICPLNYGKTSAPSPNVIIRAKFESSTDAISPIIDISMIDGIFVNKDIFTPSSAMNVPPNSSNRYIPETDPSKGSAVFKYVTRKIQLAKPALDILLLLDVNNNVNSDYDIFYRFLSPSEVDSLENRQWIQVPIKKIITNNEFIETETLFSEVFGSAWVGHDEISEFQIKIVGYSKDIAKPPLFSNLRVIALT